MLKRLVLVLMLFVLSGCGYGNLDYVKEHATEKWKKQGFEVVDYEGYQWGNVIPFTTYGGANVWYRLKKTPNNGVTYSGCLQRWGDEIHVYNLKAIDAIKPTN